MRTPKQLREEERREERRRIAKLEKEIQDAYWYSVSPRKGAFCLTLESETYERSEVELVVNRCLSRSGWKLKYVSYRKPIYEFDPLERIDVYVTPKSGCRRRRQDEEVNRRKARRK